MSSLFDEITITIVLYEENLASVSKCLKNLKNFKIVIVDNAGDYNLKEEIEKNFKIEKYIVNKSNTGFSKGSNQAIKLCKTKFILSIEIDCIILEKDIQILMDSYKKYQNCFIVTPTFYNEKSELSYNGGPLPDNNIGIETINIEGDLCVESASTAAILFKRSDLIEIGLFDENLFIYFPDFEISRRIKKTGKSIIQIFDAKSTHVHGELKVKNFFKKIFFRNYYFTLDELRYYQKINNHHHKFNELKKKIPKLFIKFIINLVLFRWGKSIHSLARIFAYYKFKISSTLD